MSATQDILVTFKTKLGWMVVVGRAEQLRALTFGHETAHAARRSLDPRLAEGARAGTWNQALVERLKAYAAGIPQDFRDVPLDPGYLTEFGRRVVACCREIPYGKTLSYGQLAAKAGYPGAARAVGNCMAANRIALVIPCHRVVAAGGRVGNYSAAGGSQMKTRLLAMERERSA